MSYKDRLRVQENPNRPPAPTDKTAKIGGVNTQRLTQGADKTDETEPAAGIGGSVGALQRAYAKIEGDGSHLLWHVVKPDGETWVSYFSPASTSAEFQNWYPDAQVERIPSPDRGDPLDPETQARIIGWLDVLSEDCPQTRREVLQRAQADQGHAPAIWALAQAATAPRPETQAPRPEHRRGTSDQGDRPC